jgi:tRNA(adenine34) deaminase
MSHVTPAVFSPTDRHFMILALEKAVQAFNRGDFPVGSALVVDGVCVDLEANSNTSDWSWASHAEHKLILKHAPLLRRAVQVHRARIELFTTFEPCLMCLGAAVFNRIRRIVYALPDPTAGAACFDVSRLGEWYYHRWPLMQAGLLRYESEQLIQRFQPVHPRTDD